MDGRIPQDESKLWGYIVGSSGGGSGKSYKVIVKTPHEAMGVPTKEANAAGYLQLNS